MKNTVIAETQKSFIYLELDELYANSHLPEPLKKEIHGRFKDFLAGITDQNVLTELTDEVFELGSNEEDGLSALPALQDKYGEQR